MTLTSEFVSGLLYRIWMEQACRNPAHREETLQRLLGNKTYALRVEEVVAAILAANACVVPAVADLEMIIWRAFSPLDAAHRHELAEKLIEAAHG
jgi:hypothetical protein